MSRGCGFARTPRRSRATRRRSSPARAALRYSAGLLASLSVFFTVAGAATAATTLAGTPTVGTTLDSPYPSDPTDWYQCDATGTTLTSEVATAQPSYTVAETDVGAYICAVDTTTSATAVTGTAASDPNATGPTIAGTAQQGQTLSITADGSWTDNSPSSYEYQWFDCAGGGTDCTAIAGADGSSYTLQSSDVGGDVELQQTPVYGSQAAGGAATQSHDGDTVVIAAPAQISTPTISGSARQGQTLKASTGSWSNSPTAYSYQWEHCALTCTAIAGATGTSYRLTDADVGDALAVDVTAANAGGSATAQSAHTAIVSASTTTALVAAPTTAHINQPVMLTAVITSSADTADPSGTVTFFDGGSPISGCTGQNVSGSSQSTTVTCATSFGLSSPSLTATFAPGASAPLDGSSSAAQAITVQPDATTTTLDVPSEVKRGAVVTYTATVQPADNLTGPVVPGGRVRFLNHGHAVRGCARQRLETGGATCTTTYPGTGSERISASYAGTDSFSKSSSNTKTVRVVRALPRSHGHLTFGSITATMQWTFHFTPSYTRILAFVLHGLPAHSKVTITCAGRGCPFHSHAHRVAATRARLNIGGAFHRRRLHVHATVVVTVTRSRYVGKYYRFTIMPRRQPTVRISCLAPGSARPGVGCHG